MGGGGERETSFLEINLGTLNKYTVMAVFNENCTHFVLSQDITNWFKNRILIQAQKYSVPEC